MAGPRTKLTFPTLFSDEEIERRRTPLPDAGPPATDPWPVLDAEFPRIAKTIRELWGKADLDRYFDRLLIDDRGNRDGFPLAVVDALLALSRRHRERYGFPPPAVEDWRIGPTR